MESDYSEIYRLEPEEFDWLDLASEFFKHDGSFSYGIERNGDVIRHGKRYDEIEREYDQLNSIHELVPEHTVEPLMSIYRRVDGKRKMAGFYMEKEDGALMKDYLRDSKDVHENLAIVKDIERTVRKMHENGVVHGDLANNIFYDGESWKMFDPVGEPYSEDGYDKMRRCDLEDIEVLEAKAKAPFGDLMEEASDVF
ncbi:MAG: lipopolysaccharide kinase InaA family protein [Candidatus Nanohaloarchaea archaeon]